MELGRWERRTGGLSVGKARQVQLLVNTPEEESLKISLSGLHYKKNHTIEVIPGLGLIKRTVTGAFSFPKNRRLFYSY